MKKEFEIVVVDGKELRKYPDGSLRDEHGTIRKLSPERAKKMQQRRKVKGMILAGEAIKEATDSKSVDDGVKKLVRKRLEVAMTDNGRAGNDAARWFLQMAEYFQVDRKLDVGVHHEVKPVQLDEETKALLTEMLKERRLTDHMKQDNVIDAEAEDVPGDIYKE